MEQLTGITKQCLHCSKPVKGRTDKKFCDDYCRNIYNNQLKAISHRLVRNINNSLAKNRRILENLIPPGDDMIKVSREKMQQLGYHFKFNTHLYTNKKGGVYYYCYDYGFLPLENDWCLVVKARED